MPRDATAPTTWSATGSVRSDPAGSSSDADQPWDRPSALHPTAQLAGVWEQAARQSQATRKAVPVASVQLALDLGDAPVDGEISGLPEMDASERVRAELEILGLDVSTHVVEFYAPLLDAMGVTRSADLLHRRSRSELLVAGVKVATQTPPIRSGRRVVFLTLDDATGPVDATFFEDAQGPYAATVFHSWLLVVRGELRRTGRRGVSLRATGCWELPVLHAALACGRPRGGAGEDGRGPRGLRWRARRGRRVRRAGGGGEPVDPAGDREPSGAGAGDRQRHDGRRDGTAPGAGALERVHDVAVRRHQAGRRRHQDAPKKVSKDAPRKLWHSSPGSSGG